MFQLQGLKHPIAYQLLDSGEAAGDAAKFKPLRYPVTQWLQEPFGGVWLVPGIRSGGASPGSSLLLSHRLAPSTLQPTEPSLLIRHSTCHTLSERLLPSWASQ